MNHFSRVVSLLAAGLMLVACSSTQYIMSTKEGNLIISYGKPELDEKTGAYVYRDAEGRKASISKADIMQVMER